MSYRVSLLALWVVSAASCPALFAAGALPQPLSYSKPVPGQELVFVMLGDAEAEAAQRSDEAKRQFQRLRETYPKSGLYDVVSRELVWEFSGPYVPYENTFLARDGVHMARLEGDWWVEKEYPGGKRLAAEEEARQLANIGVAFYANGEELKSYPVSELVTNPADLKHSPEYVLWAAGAVLQGAIDEGPGRFVLHTQDANRVVFELSSGEVLSRDKVGLSNPLFKPILAVSGVIALVILGTWAWLVFGRKSKPETTASLSSPSADDTSNR